MPKWTDNIQRVKLSLLSSLRRPHEYHSLPVYGDGMVMVGKKTGPS